MKEVFIKAVIFALVAAPMTFFAFCLGRRYQKGLDAREYPYQLHALQLTANDIPYDYMDEAPGMGGTVQHPDTCVAYYQPEKQSIMLTPIHK